MSKERIIKMVQTDIFFLYFPIYYCETNDFFGLLPSNTHIKIVTSPLSSDKSAFSQLMNDNDTLFAVCDPSIILQTNDNESNWPIPVMSLVINTAFWAVNHGRYKSRTLKDLSKYDKIIAYKQGTTSYAIAKKIYLTGNKEPKIEIVGNREEIIALHDSPNSQTVLALTPHVERVENIITHKEKNIEIDLELGVTPELNNVLVTALLAKENLIKNEPELVGAVVAAIQRAILMCIYEEPEIISSASKRFSITNEEASGAFRLANDSELFPANGRIRKVHWVNSCKASYETDDKEFDEKAIKRAEKVYDDKIKKVGFALVNSFLDGITSYGREDPRTRNKSDLQHIRRILSLVSLPILSIGFIFYLFGLYPELSKPMLIIGYLISCIAGIEGLALLFGLHKNKVFYLMHWLILFGLALLLLWLPTDLLKETPHWTLISITIALEFGLITFFLNKKKTE